MSNIFDNLTRLTDFKIVNFKPREGTYSNEPDTGVIKYKDELYYFVFHHEFDSGNTYIVYEDAVIVFYFCLYNDIDGGDCSPMLFEDP